MQERTKLLFIDKQFQNSYPKFIVRHSCKGADKRVFLYFLNMNEIFFKVIINGSSQEYFEVNHLKHQESAFLIINQIIFVFQIKTRLKDLQKFRNIGIHITDEVTCGYNWYFNHVFFFSMTGRVKTKRFLKKKI